MGLRQKDLQTQGHKDTRTQGQKEKKLKKTESKD